MLSQPRVKKSYFPSLLGLRPCSSLSANETKSHPLQEGHGGGWVTVQLRAARKYRSGPTGSWAVWNGSSMAWGLLLISLSLSLSLSFPVSLLCFFSVSLSVCPYTLQEAPVPPHRPCTSRQPPSSNSPAPTSHTRPSATTTTTARTR